MRTDHDESGLVPIRRRARDPSLLDGQQKARALFGGRGHEKIRGRVREALRGGRPLTQSEIRDALVRGLISMTTPGMRSVLVGSLAHYDRATGILTPVAPPPPSRCSVLVTRELDGELLEIGVARSFDRWANSRDFHCYPRTAAMRAAFLRAALEAATAGDPTLYDPGHALDLEIVMGRRGVPLILADAPPSPSRAGRPLAPREERRVRLIPDGWRWERPYLARPPAWLRGEVPLARMEALLPDTMRICLRHALVKAEIRSADVRGARLTRQGVDLRLAPAASFLRFPPRGGPPSPGGAPPRVSPRPPAAPAPPPPTPAPPRRMRGMEPRRVDLRNMGALVAMTVLSVVGRR